jgi:hypothetical protein
MGDLVCWQCKRPTLVKNVAEERTMYPGRKYEVRCRSCRDANLAAVVAKTRKEAGLDPHS